MGSALMRAAAPAAKLCELLSRPLVKVCGLTRQEDVDVAVEAGADLTGFILARESPRRAPRDRVVVAESGIASRAQGAAAELAGALRT